MHYILRRKGLGKTSTTRIAEESRNKPQVLVAAGGASGMPEFTKEDYVFRWGCTSFIPEKNTKGIINKVSAIHLVNDKKKFRLVLDSHGLSPVTAVDADDYVERIGLFPAIVRRATHSQGKYIHLCNNETELHAACAKYGEGNYYISEFINKVAEYRVFIVCGRVVWVTSKIPGNPDDIAWNVARGGRFENVRWKAWPMLPIKKALEAMHISGLHFGGVDVMVDTNGVPFILEINSAPSQTSAYRQKCTAAAFDYITEHGPDEFEAPVRFRGYGSVIHPAINKKSEE